MLLASTSCSRRAGKTINAFDRTKWQTPEVAYAGELLVNPGDCTYSLNGGSGTYRPDKGLKDSVTQFFQKVFNQDSSVLPGIGNWCPTPTP